MAPRATAAPAPEAGSKIVESIGACARDSLRNHAANNRDTAERYAFLLDRLGVETPTASRKSGRDTLIQAIRTQQLMSADEVGRKLNAGSNCGSCIPELTALISGAHASQHAELPS